MDLNSCFRLGQILRPHGIKGEVAAFIESDNPEEYLDLESVFVLINQKPVPFFIEDVRLLKQGEVAIKFEDIDDQEQARELINHELYLPVEELPQLEEGEFYLHDVIGYTVEDQKLGTLGVIEEIYERHPQDLLLMRFKEAEIFIPVEESILLSADHDNKILKTALPDGLIDIYFSPDEEADDKDE